jgi:AAA-like domain
MRAPIAFVYGNCVFGEDLSDAWAAFAVPLESYEWLAIEEKRARFVALVGALESAEADVQILRVSDHCKHGRYFADETEQPAPNGTRRTEEHRRYLSSQLAELESREATTSALYLLVSLREPELDVASYVSRAAAQRPSEWLAAVRRNLSGQGRKTISAGELERTRVRADRAHARLADFLPLRPARGVELQWLVRRVFCRGLGEPEVDGLHEPSALIFERNGEAVLAPLEGDVLRWLDSEIEQRSRSLLVESELGISWQALLTLGAVPEVAGFPGHRAELMFAPPETLPFAVDISVTARFLPNELALRLARRKIQDADQILRAEAGGEQGASDLGYERTQEARDLLAHLQASRRPPLLRATIGIAVGAPSERELESRIELARRAYGEVRLHRPLGDQLQLFVQHLPGQRARVPGYDDTFTAEQLAAMMPTATHLAGSHRGYHLGHTLSGSRRPVLFNLREGSDQDTNTTILSVGALGSGKTTLAQKLQYEGFLQGARVIDCDPKGDHRFHLLEDVAPHVEALALRPDPGLRGVLDPLRVAPAHMRQEATVSFLRDLLPGRAEPLWETAIVSAVDRVLTRASCPSCLEVVRALAAGLRRPRGRPARAWRPASHLPADPRSPRPAGGGRPLRLLAGRARRGADRTPDRDVRPASDERRAPAIEAVRI